MQFCFLSLTLWPYAAPYPRVDPGLGFGGAIWSFNCRFQLGSFLKQLFAIANTTVWGDHGPVAPFGSAPERMDPISKTLIVNFYEISQSKK